MLFVPEQLQLVLVLSEEPLEAQVLSDDGEHLVEEVPLPLALERVGVGRGHTGERGVKFQSNTWHQRP